jgi:Tc toxin complex TcA C-terminal TcB-binding domain
MQSELSRLCYEYYRFAFDLARKAERMVKHELMRPELDGTQFVKFNYWDSGHRGLLSGEALYLDRKRLELAYHENNQREFELTDTFRSASSTRSRC